MKRLAEWTELNLKEKYYHPLLVIAAFLVTFLAIHPFQDGNGRLSRVLTIFLLLKAGYVYAPYSSMESIIEDNKNGYYKALRQTQITLKGKPDYDPWFMFFLRTLQKQKIRLEHKIDNLKDDFLMSIPKLSMDIVNLIEEHKRLTTEEIQTLTNANKATIKKHLKNLTDSGYLQKHGTTKGSWYTAQFK